VGALYHHLYKDDIHIQTTGASRSWLLKHRCHIPFVRFVKEEIGYLRCLTKFSVLRQWCHIQLGLFVYNLSKTSECGYSTAHK